MAIGNLKRMKTILGEKATEYLLSLLLLCKTGDSCIIEKEAVTSTEYYFQLKYLLILKTHNLIKVYDRKDKILCNIDRIKIQEL